MQLAASAVDIVSLAYMNVHERGCAARNASVRLAIPLRRA